MIRPHHLTRQSGNASYCISKILRPPPSSSESLNRARNNISPPSPNLNIARSYISPPSPNLNRARNYIRVSIYKRSSLWLLTLYLRERSLTMSSVYKVIKLQCRFGLEDTLYFAHKNLAGCDPIIISYMVVVVTGSSKSPIPVGIGVIAH